MKNKFFFLSFLVLAFCINSTKSNAQSFEDLKAQGFEVFNHQDGDTTYLMKKYFMVHLIKGPTRDQNKEEAAKIQRGHLEHLSKLAKDKKLCVAGPFAEDGDIQGLVIYSVPSKDEVVRLANADPAVLAGRLVIEIHPFWAAVGSVLF